MGGECGVAGVTRFSTHIRRLHYMLMHDFNMRAGSKVSLLPEMYRVAQKNFPIDFFLNISLFSLTGFKIRGDLQFPPRREAKTTMILQFDLICLTPQPPD